MTYEELQERCHILQERVFAHANTIGQLRQQIDRPHREYEYLLSCIRKDSEHQYALIIPMNLLLHKPLGNVVWKAIKQAGEKMIAQATDEKQGIDKVRRA